jgi:hypothetical protein
MKSLYFRCVLLTDIVLNQKAATEGNQNSLDFIPGSNFLGIVAKELYADLKPEESLELFHSGKVRFGDAHPEKNGKRTLRVPASMYKSKLGKMEDGLYIHHEVSNPDEDKYKIFQPKQCRDGFYLFENEYMEEVEVKKSFAIKSAYDKEFRRSADEKMYGYESLESGSKWLFEVTLENDTWESKIKEALTGKKRVGRSRTAQYGLVEIEEVNDYKNIESNTDNSDFALVYADARLIFLDEYGIPTFQPTAESLDFKDGEIDWNKTQIRTFQYAPWNFQRQARDTDRCGIEKGSVIYVKKKEGADRLTYPKIPFVGVYQNEGFGKVIINPDFLKAEQGSNGKALYKKTGKQQDNEKKTVSKTSTNPLFVYLTKQKEQAKTEREILKWVNEFVEANKSNFTKENFASQWGAIRSIAMQNCKKNDIKAMLFCDKTGYLTHGVAKDKWDERGRRDKFKKFVDKNLDGLPNKDFQSAIINLAS